MATMSPLLNVDGFNIKESLVAADVLKDLSLTLKSETKTSRTKRKQAAALTEAAACFYRQDR